MHIADDGLGLVNVRAVIADLLFQIRVPDSGSILRFLGALKREFPLAG